MGAPEGSRTTPLMVLIAARKERYAVETGRGAADRVVASVGIILSSGGAADVDGVLCAIGPLLVHEAVTSNTIEIATRLAPMQRNYRPRMSRHNARSGMSGVGLGAGRDRIELQLDVVGVPERQHCTV